MDLLKEIVTLTKRFQFMSACLVIDNPRIRGLGPLLREFKTFHINEGVAQDQVERMVGRLKQAQRDLDREYEAVDAFWEKWEQTSGDMPRDKVTRALKMMTEWRDGKSDAAARELIAEAQKCFGMDDGIEGEGFRIEQLEPMVAQMGKFL